MINNKIGCAVIGYGGMGGWHTRFILENKVVNLLGIYDIKPERCALAKENGISHFIEHVMFKGTENRTAFEISDHIDRIGAQINAFTSKELTCYYTKSTGEHLENSLEVLSDIFFNSVFDKDELEKEKGVVIEEINMSEDTPEELCLDLLAKSYYGNCGLGQTILGPSKNIRSFSLLFRAKVV